MPMHNWWSSHASLNTDKNLSPAARLSFDWSCTSTGSFANSRLDVIDVVIRF